MVFYKLIFGWFDNLGDDVCQHGVSAMDAVIIWKGSLNANVIPVKYDSTRVCDVTAELGDTRMLMVCIYMPCDDNRPTHNIFDYKIALNDIKTICNSVNV